MKAFASKWPTLGRAVHYFFHLDSWDGELPGPRSRSKVNSRKGSTTSYPTPELVDAIDRRAGWSDTDVVCRDAFPLAMRQLEYYDPLMYRLVATLCVHGEVQQLPGARLRHLSAETVLNNHPFDGDERKMRHWLTMAWEMIAAQVATEKAREALPAAEWATGRLSGAP